MDADEFYRVVDAHLGAGETLDLPPSRVAKAVLAALATRLTHEEAMELASDLPDEVADQLADAAGELPFDRDSFIEDVAGRLDVDDVDGELAALAVLTAVREALEPTTDQVLETLPSDLARLLQASE